MATKNEMIESGNKVINMNKGQQNLFNRIVKLFNHPVMNNLVADAVIAALEEWKNSSKEREIKKIEERIAELEEMKKSLQ